LITGELRSNRLCEKEVDVANKEHLAQLKKGVEHWNRWWRNQEALIDLSNANLSGIDLSEAILAGANLSGAKLNGTKLIGAFLYRVDFRRADLSEAQLSRAKLTEANLSRADLIGAFLIGTDLSKAKFVGAKLIGAKLIGADLSEADLSEADLSGSDFSRTNLNKANLSNVFLRASHLLESNLTSAILTGACIQDWNINNATILEDVTCEYVYLKGKGLNPKGQYHLSDRRPHSPNSIFSPGEFAKLFQKALETVDLIFVDGIDWKAFFQSFQELRSQYDDETLSIQAIEKKSGGAFVIRLEVPPEADKAAIESQAKELYERDRLLLETQYQSLLKAKDGQIAIYQEWLNSERQRSTDLTGIVKTMADKETANVTQHFHASVTGVAGNIEGDQNIYASPEKQSLAEAAAEIQKLLKQLKQTNPTATEAEKQAFVSIAIPSTLRQRAVNALQSGGKAAIEEFLDNPYVNVAIAIIEGWKSADTEI
jgi:uncharacterized protein YjbI with pentapeptide repeats